MELWLPYAGLALTIAGLVYQMGRLVQRFDSHEKLDDYRFRELKDICTDTREDVRDLSEQLTDRKER